jgi:hypothetical protein
MAETNGKRKAGRPAGAKATKRNKNSPPVNQWEMENGVVDQAGATVFGSEAREQLREILDILRSPNSWGILEQADNRNQSQAVISLAAGMTPEPWTHASPKWLWDWLAKVSIGKDGLSFPPFAAQVHQSQVMRLHSEKQMELESFALSVLRFGTHTLRALVEKEPQGFDLAPGTFEQRPVSGLQALTELAQMVELPKTDKKRYALLETAQRIRLQKYNEARSKAINRKECYCAQRLLRQKSRNAALYLTENEVEISFRELVREHTGEDIKSLEITNKTFLELLRRYAHEFATARTFRIDFG